MYQVECLCVAVLDNDSGSGSENTDASFLRTRDRTFCYLRLIYWGWSLLWLGSELSGLCLRLWTLSFNVALAPRVKEVPLCYAHRTRQNRICRQKAFGQDWLYRPSTFDFSEAHQTLCLCVQDSEMVQWTTKIWDTSVQQKQPHSEERALWVYCTHAFGVWMCPCHTNECYQRLPCLLRGQNVSALASTEHKDSLV